MSLINRAGGLYGRILTVQTERSEVCTSDRGQDSPLKNNNNGDDDNYIDRREVDRPSLVNEMLLYGQTRKQMNKDRIIIIRLYLLPCTGSSN